MCILSSFIFQLRKSELQKKKETEEALSQICKEELGKKQISFLLLSSISIYFSLILKYKCFVAENIQS